MLSFQTFRQTSQRKTVCLFINTDGKVISGVVNPQGKFEIMIFIINYNGEVVEVVGVGTL